MRAITLDRVDRAGRTVWSLRSMKMAMSSVVAATAGVSRADEVTASLEQGAFAVANISVRGHAESVYAGAFQTTFGGGLAFESYCVDLDHNMSVSGNT